MSRNVNKIILLTVVGILCGCSNNNHNYDLHRLFYNTYESYDEMLNHLEVLNENIKEEEQLFFDFKMDGYVTKYIVAGVDMCLYYHLIQSLEEHDKNRCDYLFTREIYYELTSSDLIATIVFKEKKEMDLKDMYWTNEKLDFHGTVHNYEKNDDGDAFYLRKSETDILALKFNISNVDDEIVKLFQDKLMESVLEA